MSSEELFQEPRAPFRYPEGGAAMNVKPLNPQLQQWADAGILNAGWSMREMIDIEDMARAGWGLSDIAEAMICDLEEMRAVCRRNAIYVVGRQ